MIKKISQIILLNIIMFSCRTYLTIEEIENKITGLKTISIENTDKYQFINFTKDGNNVSLIKYNTLCILNDEIEIFNLEHTEYKRKEYTKKDENKRFFQKQFMIELNYITAVNFSIEYAIFIDNWEFLKIEYHKITKKNKEKIHIKKEYKLNKKISEIHQSFYNKHQFIITYSENHNDFSLLSIGPEFEIINYNLLLYDENNYQKQKDIFPGRNNQEAIVRGFNDSERIVFSFYNFVKKEIYHEIIFNFDKLTDYFGITYAVCSPSGKYIFLSALKFHNFILDLDSFELIRLPYNYIEGIEDIYILDWSLNSKHLLLEINDHLFILDIDAYRESDPPIYQLNSEYFWELEYEKNNINNIRN